MQVIRRVAVGAAVLLLVGCSAEPADDDVDAVAGMAEPAPTADAAEEATPVASEQMSPSPEAGPSVAAEPTPTSQPAPTATARPGWYQQRELPLTGTGYPAPQEVPPEYVDRRLVTVTELPPPADDAFVGRASAVPDDVLARSTWTAACPVTVDELSYLTVSFWGFDGGHHTGELLVHTDLAADLLAVFELLHAERFPIERMMVTSADDLDGYHQRGDDNTTTGFECRAVTGASSWSQHSYGRAIDINPFHNPYLKQQSAGTVLLPVYAGAYLDRGRALPGQVDEGDPVVALFDELGWEWGGRWNTLKDWQHFVCREGAPCDGD